MPEVSSPLAESILNPTLSRRQVLQVFAFGATGALRSVLANDSEAEQLQEREAIVSAMNENYTLQRELLLEMNEAVNNRFQLALSKIADQTVAMGYQTRQKFIHTKTIPVNGVATVGYSSHFSMLVEELGLIQEMESYVLDDVDHDYSNFTAGFETLIAEFSVLEASHKKAIMTTPEGKILKSFPEELEQNHCLTEEEYITQLGRALRAPENLEYWRRYFFEYVADDKDQEYYAKHHLHSDAHFFQEASRTLRRVKNGKYQGDCEDLMDVQLKTLLSMGISAIGLHVVVGESGHATCVWSEKSGELYTVHDLGTCGYCVNGALLGGKQSNEYTTMSMMDPDFPNFQRNGYNDFEYALVSVLHRYRLFRRDPFLPLHYESFLVYDRPKKSFVNGNEHVDLAYKIASLQELEKMLIIPHQ